MAPAEQPDLGADRHRRGDDPAVAHRAQLCAFTGVVAGFWHSFWIAGVAVLATGLLGVAVHSAGHARFEQGKQPTPHPSEEPGDAES